MGEVEKFDSILGHDATDPSRPAAETETSDMAIHLDDSTVTKDILPGESNTSRNPSKLVIPRTEEPFCSFTEGNLQYTSLFPDIFILGNGPSRNNGVISSEEARHLFLQWDPDFSRVSHLQYLIFNEWSIKEVCSETSNFLSIRNTSRSKTEYSNFINQPNSKAYLERCIADPTSEDAKKMEKMMKNMVTSVAKKVTWTNESRKAAGIKIYSNIKYIHFIYIFFFFLFFKYIYNIIYIFFSSF
jgi:hypothetical protein